MKRFREFTKKKSADPTLILFDPIHGAHAAVGDKPTVVFAQPVHGKHSKLKEETVKTADWLSTHDNDHLGKDHNEVHNKLNMSKDKFKAHEGHEGVYNYTVGSHHINGELIHQAKHSDSSLFDHKPDYKDTVHGHIKNIDKALSKSHLEHDVHVYHGTDKWHPGHEAAKNKDNKVKLPAYTSTSIHKDIAHGFIEEPHKNGHVLHIHMKKGQKAMYVGSNSEHDEKEMLLPRNTTLKIHPHPTKLGDGTHVWHAHVTDD